LAPVCPGEEPGASPLFTELMDSLNARVMFLGRYTTDQVIAQAVIAHQLDDVPMRVKAIRMVWDMVAQLEAGVRRTPQWAQECVRLVDPQLTLRWNFELNCWTLDRFVREYGYSLTVVNMGQTLTQEDVSTLVRLLHEGDMQRFATPEDYLKQKNAKAEKKQEDNSKAGDEKVLEAVDSLTNKQVSQFIETETAIRHGERIRPLGQDAISLEKMAKAGENSPAPPPDSEAINPGMHPNVHRHKSERTS
jgi:hypothetical protein